jgi:hypothetical protein
VKPEKNLQNLKYWNIVQIALMGLCQKLTLKPPIISPVGTRTSFLFFKCAQFLLPFLDTLKKMGGSDIFLGRVV